jgi:hypothetical protein
MTNSMEKEKWYINVQGAAIRHSVAIVHNATTPPESMKPSVNNVSAVSELLIQ